MSVLNVNPPLDELTGAELRLALAEAEAAKPRTWKASLAKKDRIAALTAELVKRGCF